MDISEVSEAKDLNRWLRERDLKGFWDQDERAAELKPKLWKWDDIYTGIMKATEVVPMEDTFRRNVQLIHPIRPANLRFSLQCIMPGESAKAHRHTCSVLYFAFRGYGATVIENERVEWSQGDVFLIPPWAKHAHENLAMEDAILFSVTDWPAIQSLGFYKEELD